MSPVNHSDTRSKYTHEAATSLQRSPVLGIRGVVIQKRQRHPSGGAVGRSLDDGDVIDRGFLDISDVDYDADDSLADDSLTDESSAEVDPRALAATEQRLTHAIRELRALDDRIEQEHRRYSQARQAGVGFKRFVYSRRLQLLALEGVRSAFSAYTARCRDQLYVLIK